MSTSGAGPDRSPAPFPPEDDAPPWVGPYQLTGRIGDGSMSVLYGAVDTRDGTPRALKFLPGAWRGDRWRRDALAREYRIGKTLSHPNLVRILDLVRDDGRDFLVLERIDGIGLRDRMESFPLSPGESLEVAKGMAGALQHIHESDRRNWRVHGDVKPENVMLRHGDGAITAARVVLLDFGTLTVSARTVGGSGWVRRVAWNLFGGQKLVGCSSLYVSPEQAMGQELDPRSDLYSLGVVLYELFAGRPPFLPDAEERFWARPAPASRAEHPRFLHRQFDRELLDKHARVPAPPPTRWNPRVPTDLETLILRCLQKTPADRYPDALTMLVDLTHMRFDADGTFRNARRTLARTTATAAPHSPA